MTLRGSWKPTAYPRQIKSLGEHLRVHRLELGLRQKEVAERPGVTESTIVNWELGHTRPNLQMLPKVIEFMGHDPRPEPEAGSVSQALVRYRLRRGISQRQLATSLRVDPSTLAKWERGIRVPSGRFLQRVNNLPSFQACLSLRQLGDG